MKRTEKRTEELGVYVAPRAELLRLQPHGMLRGFSVELDWDLEEGEEDAIEEILDQLP